MHPVYRDAENNGISAYPNYPDCAASPPKAFLPEKVCLPNL